MAGELPTTAADARASDRRVMWSLKATLDELWAMLRSAPANSARAVWLRRQIRLARASLEILAAKYPNG